MSKMIKKRVAIISSVLSVVVISTLAILISMGKFAKADNTNGVNNSNNVSVVNTVESQNNVSDVANVCIEEESEEYDDASIDGYKYLEWYEFLEQSANHEDISTVKEIRQIRIHKYNGEARGYTNTKNSFKINKILRAGQYDTLDDEDKLTVDTLTNMCNRIESPKKCLMLRLVAIDYLSTVYGIKSKDGEDLTREMFNSYTKEEKLELEERLQSIVGTTMEEKGFMSASMLPSENKMGARVVEMTIKVPEQSKYYVTINYNQSEAVFPPGAKLTVDSVKYDEVKNKYVMVVSLSQ